MRPIGTPARRGWAAVAARPSCLCLAGLLLVAADARAQLPPVSTAPPATLWTEAPTRGPEIPGAAVAGAADAFAVSVNPANLAFLRAWGINLLYTQLSFDGARGPGGAGIYAATPLPWLDWIAVGAAVELQRPPGIFPWRDQARLGLSVAVRPTRFLSLGLTWAHVFAGESPGVEGGGIDTLDVAASLHLGRWLGAALVVHDLPAPHYAGLAIQRVWQPELSVRPLGDDRLELAVSLRGGERRGDVNPAARLQATLVDGVVLKGAVEYVPDLYGDRRGLRDVRATVGLQLDLAHFGIGGYALFGGGDARKVGVDGWAVTARISGERWPALFRLGRLERIDLGKGSDRELTRSTWALRRCERDRKCQGVLAVVGGLDGGWGRMEELRRAFTRLRAAGKHVYVYGAELSMKAYYVAAAAERILLDPAGGVRLVGLSSTGFYLKGLGDLLGVQADFVKIAEYKTAPEQFTRSGASDESKAMRGALLDDVYHRVLAEIAADRHLDVARVEALVAGGPYPARAAREAGLVDELTRGDEVEEAMSRAAGTPLRALPPVTAPARPRGFAEPAIAAIFVEGDIVEGRSRNIPILGPLLGLRSAGHETIIRALEQAREDGEVKAIVVRVDSPGGSALASDLIAREVDRTRRVKPVVCSFGDTAASGGYFLAAHCDAIYADASTITGSIGIFTGKFDLSGLAARIGVGINIDKRGPRADMESWFRLYTDEERAYILHALRYYYDRFVDTVADGRHLSHEQVDAIGRGHVWTGAQAQERKLVDELGGFVEAVESARRRGGLGDDRPAVLRELPEEPRTLLGQLGELVGLHADTGAGSASLLPAVLAPLLLALPASVLDAPGTPQARLPWAVLPE